VSTGPLPQPPAAGPPEPPPPTDRRGPAVAVVLVGALLVLVGIGWLLDANGVGVPWRAILPAALIAIGLATVAGAFRGRQEALMAVGVALTVVLSVALAADWDLEVPLAGGVGDRTAQPVTPAELTDYELGAGDFRLDLGRLEVPPGTTTVRARVGFGELAVDLPGGVAVEVDARAGVGSVQAFGREESGVGTHLETSGQDGAAGDRRLVLDLRVGVGRVEVDR
jgi:predicted membrane protein